jgi:hypothetical protein
MTMFACLIIRTFQLVFLAGTVFFSHNKSANSTFSRGFSAKRTCSMYILGRDLDTIDRGLVLGSLLPFCLRQVDDEHNNIVL